MRERLGRRRRCVPLCERPGEAGRGAPVNEPARSGVELRGNGERWRSDGELGRLERSCGCGCAWGRVGVAWLWSCPWSW
jgi:hypothetical protein